MRRRSKKLSERYVKNNLEKGYKFVVENYGYDNYCRLIWTINS